jgi:hypothetical protein
MLLLRNDRSERRVHFTDVAAPVSIGRDNPAVVPLPLSAVSYSNFLRRSASRTS